MLTGKLIELRALTDDDEAVLYRVAADIDTWEERSPRSPAPLTLAAYREREAKFVLAGDTRFVVAVDGQAIGTVALFNEDPLGAARRGRYRAAG